MKKFITLVELLYSLNVSIYYQSLHRRCVLTPLFSTYLRIAIQTQFSRDPHVISLLLLLYWLKTLFIFIQAHLLYLLYTITEIESKRHYCPSSYLITDGIQLGLRCVGII